MIRYYHGGVKNLGPGDMILPPAETGKSTLLHIAQEIKPDGPQRADRVYVTTEVAAAMMFAALYPFGWVYRVTPIGSIEQDPDCLESGLSLQCERARIDAVVRMNVHPDVALLALGETL